MVSQITILTGAGVSAESGVKTFRDDGGLWEGHRVEDVATPEAFQRDPELVHHFYNLRRAQLNEVEPNDAHRALARLVNEAKAEVTLVTQNVDDLHERAGLSENQVWHMHGQLRRVKCQECGRSAACDGDLLVDSVCGLCGKKGEMRPDIVWFGEIPYGMDRIQNKLVKTDLFLAVGTSGAVYPAAGFVSLAKAAGAKTLEFNLEATNITGIFDEVYEGLAGETVSAWVEKYLEAE